MKQDWRHPSDLVRDDAEPGGEASGQGTREAGSFGRDGHRRGWLESLLTAHAAELRGGGSARHVPPPQRAPVLASADPDLELVVRGAADGLWHWDLALERFEVSPRWREMLGLGPIGSGLAEWVGRVHPEDRDDVDRAIAVFLAGSEELFRSEHRMLHADGSFRWVRWRGRIQRDAEGRALSLGGSMSDVSEARALREATLREALYDALTSLPNRTLLVERLGRAVERTNRPGAAGFAVLILDVDRFRVVNDGLGNASGDRLLHGIGQRLEALLRPGDTVARLAGDEFAVLLEEVEDVSDVERVVRRITASMRTPFQLEAAEVVATLSMGVAYGLGGSPGSNDVLSAAAAALHRAKASGRGRHAVFEPSMHWRAVTSLRLENDLRRALERDELRLAYQPIVDLGDGGLAGFEALLRWRHPQRGPVPPSEFVRIAEESGLILPLGEWVLRQACRSGRAWRDRFGHAPAISVNLSGRQLSQPGLVESVTSILAETGMDERQLGLEITESAMIENARAAHENLARLKALSIRISVDDFGTGHSCLSRLHTFPVDALKVDRSFIARMDARRGARETVRAIIALARDLQLDVVAEGIETLEQREALESLECRFGQGFLFAHALEAAQAETLIGGGSRF